MHTLASYTARGTHLKIYAPTSDARASYRKAFERVRAGHYARAERAVLVELNRQARAIAEAALEAGSVHEMEAAALATSNRVAGGIRSAYLRIYADVLPDFAMRTYDGLQNSTKAHRKADPELVDIWLQMALQFVDSEGGALVTAVTAHTHDQVRRIVSAAVRDGIDEGWDMEQIARRIESDFAGHVNRTRARAIGRTETIRASNVGARAGAKATGLTLQKEWLSAKDTRTRPDHLVLDETTVPVDAPFSVGGEEAMYPADPNLSPEQSVNCRCALGYLPVAAKNATLYRSGSPSKGWKLRSENIHRQLSAPPWTP